MGQRVEFSPSRRLALILLAVHGLALYALAAVLPLWAGVACAALMLASLAYYLARDAWLRLGASCIGLVTDAEGVVMLLRDGTQLPCRVLADSLVTPALVVLNVRPRAGRGARSVVILPDSLDAEAFRRLRVWLRWGERAAADDAPE